MEDIIIAMDGIDIVGEHQSELLAIGPAFPILRRFGRVGIDRPNAAAFSALVGREDQRSL